MPDGGSPRAREAGEGKVSLVHGPSVRAGEDVLAWPCAVREAARTSRSTGVKAAVPREEAWCGHGRLRFPPGTPVSRGRALCFVRPDRGGPRSCLHWLFVTFVDVLPTFTARSSHPVSLHLKCCVVIVRDARRGWQGQSRGPHVRPTERTAGVSWPGRPRAEQRSPRSVPCSPNAVGQVT